MNINENNQFMSRQGSLMKKLLRFIFTGVFFIFSVFSSTNAKAFDFSDWDIILKKYVQADLVDGVSLNTVAYEKLMRDPIFNRLKNNLELFSLSRLTTNEEKLAFWINVYNIFAVKVVTDNYPLKSIKDVGGLLKSVWKVKAGTVDSRQYTLDEIEHGILRKMGEPRIHIAIVCASISCPDLSIDAYIPERLNEQLDIQMRKFLGNPGKGMRRDADGKKIFLSPIFAWFSEDFESRGGVRKFIQPYVLKEAMRALKNPNLKIYNMKYNWRLNDNLFRANDPKNSLLP